MQCSFRSGCTAVRKSTLPVAPCADAKPGTSTTRSDPSTAFTFPPSEQVVRRPMPVAANHRMREGAATGQYDEMTNYPNRIVCLTEETTEALYLLGQQDRIVGVSGYTV